MTQPPDGTPDERPEQGYGDPSSAPYGPPPGTALPPDPPAPPDQAAPPPPPGYGAPVGYGGPSHPPAGQPGYPPAGQQQGYAGYAAPTTSPKATWALVTGIVSLVLGCCGILGLLGIVSVVLGVQARREIARSNGALTGDGSALAGIVLGAIGAVSGLVVGTIGFVLFATGDTSFTFGS